MAAWESPTMAMPTLLRKPAVADLAVSDGF
jgi:hypothetical protein